MKVTNDRGKCVVEIACDRQALSNLNAKGAVTAIRLKRRGAGTLVWAVIGELTMTDGKNEYKALDIYAVSHKSYDYLCVPVIGGKEGVGETASVQCEFDGIFIGNLEKQYVCGLNPSMRYTLHTAIKYVQTFHSKYPHSIQNGSLAYATGSVSGLFLPMDEQGEFTTEGGTQYKIDMLKGFLADGTQKLLKDPTGHSWAVQIDAEPQEEINDFSQGSEIKFNWTEIAEVPTQGIAVMA